MAWALEFDGVDDYLTFGGVAQAGTDFVLEFDSLNQTGGICYVFGNSGFDYISIGRNGSNERLIFRTSGVGHILEANVTGQVDTNDGLFHKHKIVYDGANLSYYIDNVFIASSSASTSFTGLDFVARRYTSYSQQQIKYIDYTDNTNSANSFLLDATASDHGNTGSQPVLVDTIGSNNATGVNMPTDGSAWKPIFPAPYTLLVEYDLPTITGTHTDFVALLKYDDFNVGDALNFWDNGGGDLRISDDINGTTQLPIEVVEFDKVGLSAQVWVKIPSAFTGKTIYLWGDNTGDSQPAVTDTYGRNAVWSGRKNSYELNESSGTVATDSAGNFDGTYGGNLPTLSTGGGGQTFVSGDKINTGFASFDTSQFTLSAIVDTDGNSGGSGKNIIANDDNVGGDRVCQFRLDSDNKIRLIVWNQTGDIFINNVGTIIVSGKSWVACTFDGANYKTYINGALDLNIADTTTIKNQSVANWHIGHRGGLVGDGYVGTMHRASMIEADYLTGNYIATEYDNQSTAGAWGVSTRVGGGGATYTINTETSNISYSTGQHSVELSGLIEATTQTTSVSYVTGQHSIDLTGAIDVLSQTNTIDYASGQHNVSLSGLINPTTTTGVITYATGQHEVDLTGAITAITNTSNVVYSSGQHIVEIGGQIVALSDTSDINYSTGQHDSVLQGLIDVNAELNTIVYTTGQHIVYTQEPVRLTTFSVGYKDSPFTANYKNSSITARYKT